ncbi:zinc-binding dehydrogenase [Paracoccus sp. P2]|uniref:quinone oxidoreductase family protein n=1 Tax=Paracoccus TaxID=265 RepID=UPI0008EA0B0B|nr:zinc-binding alcohol dehydrogenase family protein [Paracoccus pantotrophus]MDF3856534.1 zinc-binding alcohol dehydrogenase family protein [Paracoccus pantotrophus]SFP21900.1 NADPH:quinone reductase [Paracoccus pantotrophus]
MKAAVVSAFDRPPACLEIAEPEVGPRGRLPVRVLAAGLHHVTRGRAAGLHYSGTGELPFVAGMDGVGRGPDGRLRYFVQGPGEPGTMAERTVIDPHHSIVLPEGSDPVLIAGAMNPAMASWLALRCRLPAFRSRWPVGWRRQVVVLGATSASGQLAVQIARHLGAARVIAAGRDRAKLARLAALGATDAVALDDESLGEIARGADVVLDFVWGETAARMMERMLRHRADPSRPLDWIHVGSLAGDVAPLPGAVLRSARLQVMGSGHGAVSGREILRELPELARLIARGTFRVDVRPMPLSAVEQVWNETAPEAGRIVFTP